MDVRAVLIGLALIGCASSEPMTSSEEAPAPAVAPPFTGWMLVDQPGHAEYEASLYEFGADGAIRLDSTWVSGGGSYRRVDTSIATVTASGTTCEFGARYSRPSPTRLELDGACSDGSARIIVLETLASVDDPDRFGLQIVSVGGETGWTHEGFQWSLWRCGERPRCLEFLPPEQLAPPIE